MLTSIPLAGRCVAVSGLYRVFWPGARGSAAPPDRQAAPVSVDTNPTQPKARSPTPPLPPDGQEVQCWLCQVTAQLHTPGGQDEAPLGEKQRL